MEALGICARHTVDRHPRSDWYPLHSHESQEILLVISGACMFQIGNWSFHVKKGDAIVIPGGTPHRLVWENGEACEAPLEFFYTQFESYTLPQEVTFEAYMEKLYRPPIDNGHFVWRLDSVSLALSETCMQRMVDINDTPVWEVYLTYLRPLLREISLCAHAVSGEKSDILKPFRNGAWLFDRVALYIHEHYTEIRDLSFVPQEFHYSIVYVNSLFKRHVNISLWQYVIRVRLERVYDLLREGTPAEKAALICGFEDYSNFYRMFRKQYGISPAACKKNGYPMPANKQD